MTNDELRELMHRLQLDCAEAPRLIYVFYETADGLVNNFSISLQAARRHGGRPMTPDQVTGVMRQYPATRDGRIVAVEHPATGLSPWMDGVDVCRRLRICRQTLRRWVDRGLLHPSHMGRRLFYDPAEVEALLRSNIIQDNGRLDLTGMQNKG